MRSAFFRVISASVLVTLSCFMAPAFGQIPPVDPAAKLLVDLFGDFRATGAASAVKPETIPGFGDDFKITSAASRDYVSKDGQRFGLTVISTQSDSAAYALMTNARRASAGDNVSALEIVRRAQIGTDGFTLPDRLFFVKGPALVAVNRNDTKSTGFEPLIDMAKVFAEKLDRGEGEIPVLVKHLPDWPHSQNGGLYAVTLDTLRDALNNQPVLDAINFEGGAEAVVGDYGGPRMAIVEFHTPQLASDNDQRITAKIRELSGQGQPLPSAYRRVGNYSVFVFDAPSQESANQLIDQVQYQPVVQWLGRNPYLYDEAANEFTRTTLGVFIAVVKASGLAIIGTLALGGILGALLFSRRRKQQRVVAYSDAGGMLRLNLDEMTPRTDPARLLGPGN